MLGTCHSVFLQYEGMPIFDTLDQSMLASIAECQFIHSTCISANFLQTVKAKVNAFKTAFTPAFAPVLA